MNPLKEDATINLEKEVELLINELILQIGDQDLIVGHILFHVHVLIQKQNELPLQKDIRNIVQHVIREVLAKIQRILHLN